MTGYWPDGLDGTARFPENHRLLRESARLKVVDVFIAAGTAEKPHTHKLPSVMFTDQSCAIVVRHVDSAGRETVVFERGPQVARPARPDAHIVGPEPLHYVANTGLRDYLATRVEFKGGAKARSPRDLKVPPGRSLLWNSGAREAVLVADVDSKLTVSRRKGTGWKALPALDNDRPRAARPPVWLLEADSSYSIRNPGSGPERFYRLELVSE